MDFKPFIFALFILFLLSNISFASSIIGRTTTTPFYPNQRAICRDAPGNIHVAWKNSSTVIMYANSTDNGATWNVMVLNNSADTKYTPSITCDKNNISVAYVSGSVIAYHNQSTTVGWKFQSITGATQLSADGNLAIERRGYKIYLVYTNASSGRCVLFKNSSDGGITWGTNIIIKCGSYSPPYTDIDFEQPSLATNGTGSATDFLQVAANYRDIEPSYAAYYFNSTNSGQSWSAGTSWATSNSIYPSITTNNTETYITWSSSGIQVVNSSNQGKTWTQTEVDGEATDSKLTFPSITVSNNTKPCVFYSYTNGTDSRDNIVYQEENRTTTLWNAYTNVTTDYLQHQYVNTRNYYNQSGVDYVWVNGTDARNGQLNITYNMSNCTYIQAVTISSYSKSVITNVIFSNQTYIKFQGKKLTSLSLNVNNVSSSRMKSGAISAQSFSLEDMSDDVGKMIASSNEMLSFMDSNSRLSKFNILTPSSISFNDIVEKYMSVIMRIAEALPIDDSIEMQKTLSIRLSDAISFGDNIKKNAVFGMSLPEKIIMLDDYSKLSEYMIRASHSLAVNTANEIYKRVSLFSNVPFTINDGLIKNYKAIKHSSFFITFNQMLNNLNVVIPTSNNIHFCYQWDDTKQNRLVCNNVLYTCNSKIIIYGGIEFCDWQLFVLVGK